MFPVTPSNQPLKPIPNQKPRFGNLDGLTGHVDKGLEFIEGNRTRQMFLEDFIGFGLLRTGLDLFRGYFFDDDENKLNFPAAGERLLREVGSIFTDNMSSGIAAFGLGCLLDKAYKAYSNKFTPYSSLEFFQDLLKNSSNETEFLRQFASKIGSLESEDLQNILKELQAQQKPISSMGWLDKTIAKIGKRFGKENPMLNQLEIAEEKFTKWVQETATKLSTLAGKEDFDIAIGKDVHKMDELVYDLMEFKNEVAQQLNKAAQGSWKQTAEDLLKNTLKVKTGKLSCLLVGLGLTFSVPYAIKWYTKKRYNLDMYPGELGLKKEQIHKNNSVFQQRMMANQSAFSQFIQAEKVVSSTPSPTTWLDNLFPYLTESVREGNYLPLLVSLIPLPFAAGLFNTAERKFNLPFQLKEGSFKNALMAIKEKGLKAALALEKNPNFKRIWRNGLDFGKSFPFTTQQQIATMFAFLIFSRLTSARSENEFRERSVDSGMGWVLWILGTPLIKEMFAKIINPKLLKASGRFKSREEVIRFLTGDLLKKTEKNYVWFSAVSMAITVALIGIIEPLVAIQWTKRNGTSS